MQVPLLDLRGQFAAIRDEVLPAIEAILDSQACINGPAVEQLEQELAAYCDCAEGVGVSSGTDALLCGLMVLGIGQGDEVITSPFTFFATAGSIWRVGAKPVFVDIEPDTFNINPAAIEAAVTDRTRAIMPVHLFGQMCDMDAIMSIARARDLAVIEDACQAIGAAGPSGKVGSVGTVGCFSFYPTKNLGGIGDGGMITTQDAELAARMKAFRNHGGAKTYMHEWVGGNFRLDTVQAAALLVKLKYLDQWAAKRRANAARYEELFADCDAVTTPVIREGNRSVYNQYVIRVPRRDELRAHLNDNGVGSGVYYPLSLHEQDCFKELGYKRGDFPESERATEEVLALPIFPELTDEQIVYVTEQIKAFFC